MAMSCRGETNATRCFGIQDKVRATGPAEEKREVDTMLADSNICGVGPHHRDDAGDGNTGMCCGSHEWAA